MQVHVLRRWIASATLAGTAALVGCGNPCLDDGKGKGLCNAQQASASETAEAEAEAEVSEAEAEAEASEAEAGGACSNQTKDENETDVDCGGVCVGANGTGKCDDGQMCEDDDDCVSDLCEAGLCVPGFPSCSNGTQDPGETDVDCGGECVEDPNDPDDPTGKCGGGETCEIDGDCISDECEMGLCVPGTPSFCHNRTQDEDETDVDCGGACVLDPNDPGNPAGKCDDGESCEVDSDCVTNSCDPQTKVCVSVCSNGVFDPGETDVDCGGHCVFVNPEDRNDVEGQCNDMDMCVEDMDCVAGECSNGQCDVCSPQGDYTVCQTCLVTNCCPSVQACLADIPKCVCWFNCIGQPGATVQSCMTSCGNGNIGTINSCLNNACKNDCQ
jgi:hypothetical protein